MGRAIICGAGPGGAALGQILATRGVDVVLVERQSDFAREFRGEVLMPSGIAALQAMGLSEAYAALPRSRPEAIELHVRGEFAGRIELGDIGLPEAVSQPALLEMLVAEAERGERFRFVRGEAARDLVRRSDGRVSGLALGDEQLEGDLVIGCDGRGSLVRRKSGLHEERNPEHFDVVWFKVPVPPGIRERGNPVTFHLGSGHLAIAVPIYGERMLVGWVIEKGGFGDLRARGIAEWIGELASLVGPELGDHFRRHARAAEHPFVLDVVCDCVSQWWKPGVLLLGDAAHPMSPVGAQGLNIALRDALVAANHLVPVLRAERPDEAAVDAACAGFQAEREREVHPIQRRQRMAPSIVLGRARWSGLALALLPWIVGSPLVPLLGRRIAEPFMRGVTQVRLEV